MAKTYSIVFNDPNYDLVISEIIGGKTLTETESFATQELAQTALTTIKTDFESKVTNLTSRITTLNSEISAINTALGI